MFNPLPTFHCFGLTGGVLLPILTGMKAFQYPSPLHIKQIPPLVKDTGANVLFATDMPFDPAPGLYARETIRIIDGLDITTDERDRIYYRNAMKLLQLSPVA